MTTPSQSSTTIDVEVEDDQRQKTTKVLRDNCIHIPPRYQTRMAQTGLLNQLAKAIEIEKTKNQFIQQLLKKYRIYIPSEFYTQLLQNDLLDSIINLADEVDQEDKQFRTNLLKQLKNTGPQEHKEDADERSAKRHKTSDSNISISTIHSSPSSSSNKDE